MLTYFSEHCDPHVVEYIAYRLDNILKLHTVKCPPFSTLNKRFDPPPMIFGRIPWASGIPEIFSTVTSDEPVTTISLLTTQSVDSVNVPLVVEQSHSVVCAPIVHIHVVISKMNKLYAHETFISICFNCPKG